MAPQLHHWQKWNTLFPWKCPELLGDTEELLRLHFGQPALAQQRLSPLNYNDLYQQQAPATECHSSADFLAKTRLIISDARRGCSTVGESRIVKANPDYADSLTLIGDNSFLKTLWKYMKLQLINTCAVHSGVVIGKGHRRAFWLGSSLNNYKWTKYIWYYCLYDQILQLYDQGSLFKVSRFEKSSKLCQAAKHLNTNSAHKQILASVAVHWGQLQTAAQMRYLNTAD